MQGLVCISFLFLMLAECSQISSRHNGGGFKKEKHSKNKRAIGRGEGFENLFQVYDPSFLAAVWPKISNGVHLVLEVKCWEDISVFFKDFSENKPWVFKAVDASGRYSSALFSGNRFWLGSKEQCLRLDNEYTDRSNITWDSLYENGYAKAALRREKYFDDSVQDWRGNSQNIESMPQVSARDQPPYRLAYSTVQVGLNITKRGIAKSYDVILGVCLPRSCTVNDIESIINFSIMINDNLKSNRTLPRAANVISVRTIETYNFKRDVGAIVLISITILLVMLAIVATAIELDLLKCLPCNKRTMSFDLERYNNIENRPAGKENKVVNDAKVIREVRLPPKPYVSNNTVSKLVAAKKSNAVPPPTTLDVVIGDNKTGSCKRCGKYKKQCSDAHRPYNLRPCAPTKYSPTLSSATDNWRNSFCCRLFLCFSLIYSWKRIFNKNTANTDLYFVHALKIISTFWIIFIHVSVMVNDVSDNADDINGRSSAYYILTSGTMAFDTLFFVSGLFSSHHFFYLKSRYSVEELVNFGGSCGQIMQFICFVTNRVIRMLPSYTFSILVAAVMARAASDSAALALPGRDHHNCDAHWWRNVLYISNVYPQNERCMVVSWFLSTETQLHAAGALACTASMSSSMSSSMSPNLLTSTRARLVAALAVVLLVAATAADVSASYGLLYSNAYTAYSDIIDRPWARVAPYFIGVFAGWLIHVKQGRLKVSRVSASLLWAASLSGIVTAAWLETLAPRWGGWARAGGAAALLWPVLVCTTVYADVFRWMLESAGVAALSRLSYSMVLLHAPVARLLILGADSALSSRAVCLWAYFAGTSAVTVLAALLLSLLVEMPCCSLLRRISDCAAT